MNKLFWNQKYLIRLLKATTVVLFHGHFSGVLWQRRGISSMPEWNDTIISDWVFIREHFIIAWGRRSTANDRMFEDKYPIS